MHTTTPDHDTIHDAFTTSDCWALTTALCHRYPPPPRPLVGQFRNIGAGLM